MNRRHFAGQSVEEDRPGTVGYAIAVGVGEAEDLAGRVEEVDPTAIRVIDRHDQ